LEAENIALESLPDETNRVKTMEELQQCVRRGYEAQPLQMPVVLLTGNFSSSLRVIYIRKIRAQKFLVRSQMNLNRK